MTYDPDFTQPLVDSFMGCFTPPAGLGTAADGETCSQSSDCQSGYCLAIVPGSDLTYCTRPCQVQGDCPTSMACRLRALSMYSEWLAAYDQANTQAWSMLWLCDFGVQ